MGDIYCLYSSQDGMPRYVGMTEGEVDKRWKKHLTLALDLAQGNLYDWIRSVVRHGQYVGVHVLQSGIIPADLALFEGYWISQFPELFNVRENAAPAPELSDIARQVVLTIKARLVTQADVL